MSGPREIAYGDIVVRRTPGDDPLIWMVIRVRPNSAYHNGVVLDPGFMASGYPDDWKEGAVNYFILQSSDEVIR